MQMMFCENLNSTKLKMKHLGSKNLYGDEVEWLLRPMSMVPGVRALVDDHSGNRGI